MARSGNAERSFGLRPVEALRCPADAELPREHADQPCGERRRGMLTTRRPCNKSEWTLRLICNMRSMNAECDQQRWDVPNHGYPNSQPGIFTPFGELSTLAMMRF